MASVRVYGATRMKEIEDETIVYGEIVGNNLVLTKRDGTQIIAGEVTAASISLSNDETMAAESTTKAPTERAVKLFVEALIAAIEMPEPTPPTTVTSNDTDFVPVNTADGVATINVSNLARKLTVKNITTNYTALLADVEKLITVTAASGVTITLPSNSTAAFPIGSQLHFVAVSTGLPTFAAGAGATVTKPASKTLVAAETAVVVTALKISTDGWLLIGALANTA
jgi:hypothetical protein